MDKNIGNYLDCAEFETEVYPGVYWVPLNALGKTRYTNQEMQEVAKLPMEERKEKIQNLYEAVQLFQNSEFKGVLDNINCRISKQELWQIHKNQENAVRSNEGCCATDTNWLSYYLEDKYDKMGCFCYINEDANGHIATYIQQGEFYYLLDMMMCRKDSQPYFGKEDGKPESLVNTVWTGFLYKCKNPYDFCLFHMAKLKEMQRPVPYCFYTRETTCTAVTGVRFKEKGITLLVPENENPQVLYLNEENDCDVAVVSVPVKVQQGIERSRTSKNYGKAQRMVLQVLRGIVSIGASFVKKDNRKEN